MSSWSSWIPVLLYSIIPIISIQFLFKLCSNIARNVKKYTKQTVVNNKSITNKGTVCDRCNSIFNKITASSAAKNYHNKNQIKYQTFDDESFQRYVDDGENQLLSSSDDDQNIIGQVSTREVISYDRQSENNKILEVCHTKNTVSMLRKQFENVGDNTKMRNLEKQINEKFFKKASSPMKASINESIDVHNGDIKTDEQPNNDYYVIEKTKVYKVLNNNNNKENVKGVETGSADKISKLILSKRSHSNGEIKRIKRSPSHDVIAEEPISLTERTKSCDEINDDSEEIEYRKKSAANQRRSVRTFDEILAQERFSKCYSEYSISDLLNDLPDDDDGEFASFFNKIK